MSRKRGRKSKRRSGVSIKAKVIFWLILIGLVAWSGTTLIRAHQLISTIEPLTGHDFIAKDSADASTILVARQSQQSAQLDALAVVRVNYLREEIAVLNLPLQLSDGQTSIGQYIESRYYKEAQIAVEQQLALPINSYIIQTRTQAAEDPGESVLDLFTGASTLGLWSVTGGLPFYLGELTPFYTSLPQQSVWKAMWYLANAPVESVAADVPASAFSVNNTKLTLIPEQIDPIIQSKFHNPEVSQQKTTVVVKNGTIISGLATQISRFVANSGGEIVAVESASVSQEGSSLTTDTPSALSQMISDYLGIEAQQQAKTGRERADMELVVGADALTRLGQ